MNLAARLTDAARPGEILVSDAVRRTLVDRLDCEETGALAVKGLADPVLAWRLRGVSAPSASARRPLVGRDAELGQFRAVLDACVGSGRGRAVLVRGEAGIGKTRLIEEFQDAAEKAGFACHVGLVLDFGAGTGRDAIRTLVRGLLGLDHLAGGAEATGAAARAAQAEGLVVEADAVFLNDLLDLPQPVELRALYDAMDNASRNQGKRATVARLVERASARSATAPGRRGRALGGPADARASGPARHHRRRRPRRPGDDHPQRGRPVRPGLARRGREQPAPKIDLGPLDTAAARALAEPFFVPTPPWPNAA